MPIKIEIPDAGDLSATECRALRAMLAELESNYDNSDKIIGKTSDFVASIRSPKPREVRASVPGSGILHDCSQPVLEKIAPISDFQAVSGIDHALTTPRVLAREDDPAAGIDTNVTLQSAGFGAPNVPDGTATAAPIAAGLAAGVVLPVPPAMPPAPPMPGTVPGSAPTGSTVVVPLDNNGLPWDVRIHSKERTKNKDQTWRYKRGLPDGEVERVEAELRAILGVAAPAVRSLVPVPAWPFPPAPSGVPPVPGTGALMGFMQLLPKVTGAIKAGTLLQDTLTAALIEFSLPNLPAIHHRPDLVQPFHDRLFGAV